MKNDKKLNTIKIIGVIFTMALIINLIIHYKSLKQTPQLPLPIVIVKKPELTSVTEYITQTGNTVAYNSVNLVARVEGFLNAITFTDGTFIKKDRPLFVIQPEPYLEKLKAAKATVAARLADKEYAKAEYARQQRMYKDNATSKNDVEMWLAKSYASAAEVDKAVADAEIAAINYSYTHVCAPFDGRIGRHLVDLGNLVGNGVATNLATIEQIDPIYVYFNLNEIDLIKLRETARKRGHDSKQIQQIPVYLNIQNETNFNYNYKGKLDFMNTGLNASTGTMELRALMPNKDHRLVPGLFVQVRVAISKPSKQLTVPTTSLLYDQIGAYLLTVDASSHVILKRVITGSSDNDRLAILKGLNINDNVIINGLQNATPGNLVAPQYGNKTI